MLANMFDIQFTSNQCHAKFLTSVFDVRYCLLNINRRLGIKLSHYSYTIRILCLYFILSMAFLTEVWVMPLKLFTKFTFQNRILCFIGFEGRKSTILFFFYINKFCISLNLIRASHFNFTRIQTFDNLINKPLFVIRFDWKVCLKSVTLAVTFCYLIQRLSDILKCDLSV